MSEFLTAVQNQTLSNLRFTIIQDAISKTQPDTLQNALFLVELQLKAIALNGGGVGNCSIKNSLSDRQKCEANTKAYSQLIKQKQQLENLIKEKQAQEQQNNILSLQQELTEQNNLIEIPQTQQQSQNNNLTKILLIGGALALL